MKKIIFGTNILLILAACNTPNGVVGNPDNATNTSGTTGSATMTNATGTDSTAKHLPGTPVDTSVVKKDSLPPK